jgi:hypothetical protein
LKLRYPGIGHYIPRNPGDSDPQFSIKFTNATTYADTPDAGTAIDFETHDIESNATIKSLIVESGRS